MFSEWVNGFESGAFRTRPVKSCARWEVCELAVRLQEVVLIDANAVGRLVCEASKQSMPVMAVESDWQFGLALFWGLEGGCLGPFAERGLDEALCLAVETLPRAPPNGCCYRSRAFARAASDLGIGIHPKPTALVFSTLRLPHDELVPAAQIMS